MAVNYCALVSISQVQLVYPSRQCRGNPGDAMPPFYESDSGQVSEGKSYLSFRDTAAATFDTISSPTVPTNKATLDALTEQFAEDFLIWMTFTGDQTLGGICDVTPCGLYDEIVWDYWPGVARTRLSTPPVPETGRELGHWDGAAVSSCTQSATPCLLYYGPPAKCSSDGHLQLTRYRLCLQDGRLFSIFVSTDNIT